MSIRTFKIEKLIYNRQNNDGRDRKDCRAQMPSRKYLLKLLFIENTGIKYFCGK